MSAEVAASKRVVIIGLGMVADTHLQAIKDLGVEVIVHGIFARTPETRKKYAQKIQDELGYTPRNYTSLNDIVSDAEIDFAIVLTPPDARFEYIDALSAANIDILLEKPVDRTYLAAKELVELCESRNILLGMVFQYRARQASMELDKLVKSGDLGTLGMVNIEVPWWRSQDYYNEPGRGTYARDGGGVLLTQAIHPLELVLSLAGPVSQVQAMCATSRFHQMESEDFVSANLVFANRALGSLYATTASYPGDAETITLHFDHAVAKLHRTDLQVRWRNGETVEYGEDAASAVGAHPMAFKSDWHKAIIADFAQCVSTREKPIVSGREALHVHQLIDALVTSSRQQQTIEIGTIK